MFQIVEKLRVDRTQTTYYRGDNMRKEFKSGDELQEELRGEQAKDEKYEQVLSNAYFFGQFMMMDMILKIQDLKGSDAVFTFIKKKYTDIGKHNQAFVTQARKNDALVKQYYEDTMNTKF